MAKFQVKPLVQTEAKTYRLGTKAEPLGQEDLGKAVTIGEMSTMVLAKADDEIVGFISSVELGTKDGYAWGGIMETDYQEADTGDLEAGDFVVVESNPARGTAGLTKVKAAADATNFTWAVIEKNVLMRV